MHNLQAVASSSLSLPADSYIYGITAAAPGTFAAISSDDSLRVFDAADLNRGAVVSSHTHDGGVTSLRSYAGESQLLTGGRDGKVRIWDVRAGGPVVEMETGESSLCFCSMFPVRCCQFHCSIVHVFYFCSGICSENSVARMFPSRLSFGTLSDAS